MREIAYIIDDGNRFIVFLNLIPRAKGTWQHFLKNQFTILIKISEIKFRRSTFFWNFPIEEFDGMSDARCLLCPERLEHDKK